MKLLISVMIIFLYLFSFQPAIFAASTKANSDSSVYDTIKNGGEKAKVSTAKAQDSTSSPSLFPLFLKFIFSFLLVVGLLIGFMRFLSKRNQVFQSNGPVIHLGGHQLGNNRSLQILLIGQTIYVIGVGDTISLIRTISQGEEYQRIMESIEGQDDVQPPKWMQADPKKLWNETFLKQLKKVRQQHGEEQD